MNNPIVPKNAISPGKNTPEEKSKKRAEELYNWSQQFNKQR